MPLKDDTFIRAPQRSGIVIAGFGHDDVFPRLRQFQFEVIAAGRLKYTEGNPLRIGPDVQSAIIPFAQDEEVVSFMTGMAPRVGSSLATGSRRRCCRLSTRWAKRRACRRNGAKS